jgi:hypothetical protein
VGGLVIPRYWLSAKPKPCCTDGWIKRREGARPDVPDRLLALADEVIE